jgi:2-C-methyl-D-erythritol 4-phosphate cytidylyltransferase
MKGFDKVFANLAGKPVLAHSLLTFSHVPAISGALVVTAEDNIDRVKNVCDEYAIGGVLGVIAGGAERNDSARLGLEELERLGFASSTVLIHDAARPLISHKTISNIINAAQTADGAVPVIPLNDTIKRIDENNLIEATVPRDPLRAVQTPQGFELIYILGLHREAAENDAPVTDDAMLVERTGGKVIAVPGCHTNIKITRPLDLHIAEVLLNSNRD